MHLGKKIICVVPARLGSTRFPRKILAEIKGRPLLEWVYEAVKNCRIFDETIIAVDDEEVASVVEGFGGRWMMTSKTCPSGTDRLIEVHQQGVKGDVWVNWQADGPLICENVIRELLQSCDKADQDIWTLMHKLEGDVQDPSQVKVVTDRYGRALYFSRSPIPYGEAKIYYKHVGLYAYTQTALQKIQEFKPTELEMAEKLEQLRFLEHGLHIHVHETFRTTQEVDLPEHVSLIEQLLV